jgi:hypothetical protein
MLEENAGTNPVLDYEMSTENLEECMNKIPAKQVGWQTTAQLSEILLS